MIGSQDLLVGLALVLFFFGAKRLPEMARSLGKSMQEFKKGVLRRSRGGRIVSGRDSRSGHDVGAPELRLLQDPVRCSVDALSPLRNGGPFLTPRR